MKRAVAGLFVGVLIVLFVAMNISYATIPKLITVEGQLKNSTTNEPLNETYNLTFSVWDAQTGGTSLFTETHVTNPDRFGIFQVLLGSKNTLDLAFDQQYYLQTEVNSTTLSPRHKMTSAGTGYRTNTAEDLQCTNCINTTHLDDNNTRTADFADNNVTLEKLNCEYAFYPAGPADDYVKLNVGGICDDYDGCTIRYIHYPSFIVTHPRLVSWGYYYAWGDYWRFTGWENGTTITKTRTGTNDTTTDIITIIGTKGADYYCMLTDDGGNPCNLGDRTSMCAQTGTAVNHYCRIFICD